MYLGGRRLSEKAYKLSFNLQTWSERYFYCIQALKISLRPAKIHTYFNQLFRSIICAKARKISNSYFPFLIKDVIIVKLENIDILRCDEAIK